VHGVLVERDASQDAAVLHLRPGDLLHAHVLRRVELDVDREYSRVIRRDCSDCAESREDDELSPDRTLDEREHVRVVARLDRDGDARDDLEHDL
jgi:hypothetical protein